MNLIEELKWRGLLKDVTDEETLKQQLEARSPIYCGFDPTAPSLHIGHLVPIMVLSHFQRHGHPIIAVVGGGTGLIGDPSGRSSERQLLTIETSLVNAQGIKDQLSRFLDFTDERKTKMVNNYDWLKNIDVITFLRDYGKNFTINYMLAKDVVASRLDNGLSYTEFSYMLIQSIDFLTLYKKENCKIQLGGSDQWGNITAGIEMIRKTTGNSDAVGITIPLITKSDGTKFGKSAGGSFWLDGELTTPYQLYQYFFNTADADVINYIKIFTFLSVEEITELERETLANPGERKAQKTLAMEMVRIIHGEEALKEVLRMTEVLFNGKIRDLTAKQLMVCLDGVPSMETEQEMNVVDALVAVKAAVSKREAREFLKNGSIAINGEKVTDETLMVNRELAIDGKLVVVKKGKKNYFLIKMI
jgi:tyrosyl-tRNA synthetase